MGRIGDNSRRLPRTRGPRWMRSYSPKLRYIAVIVNNTQEPSYHYASYHLLRDLLTITFLTPWQCCTRQNELDILRLIASKLPYRPRAFIHSCTPLYSQTFENKSSLAANGAGAGFGAVVVFVTEDSGGAELQPPNSSSALTCGAAELCPNPLPWPEQPLVEACGGLETVEAVEPQPKSLVAA